MHERVAVESTGRTCARSAGCSRARCSCGARRPSRWATSTPPSSSTRTRPTSASACATRAGASCSYRQRGRSTTTSSRPTARRCSGASSSSTATATSTSASTACRSRASCGGRAGRGPIARAPRRRGPAGARPAPLPAARPPGARARARRGDPRGGRRPHNAGERRPPFTLPDRMDHPDLAQLAAVGGALGSVLVLLARGRLVLLAGLGVLAVAELGLAYSIGTRLARQAERRHRRGRGGAGARGGGRRGGAAGEAAGDRAGGGAGGGAVPAAAVIRQRRARSSCRSPTTAAWAACCRSTSCWPRRRPRSAGGAARPRAAPAPQRDRAAGAAFLAFACLSLIWADDLEAGANLLVFFTLPFALLLATVARADFPDSRPASPRRDGARRWRRCSRWSGSGRRHARALLLRAQPRRLERQHGLLPGDLAVRRPEPVRPPSGARHRRGAGAARGAAVEAWPLIALLVLMWAGLFFSYSQSSMAALLVVTLALAVDRRPPRAPDGRVAGPRRGAGRRGLRDRCS